MTLPISSDQDGSLVTQGPRPQRAVVFASVERLLLCFLIYGALEGLLKRLTGYAWYVYPIKDVFFGLVLGYWILNRRFYNLPQRPPYLVLVVGYLGLVAVEALNPHLASFPMWVAGMRTSYMYVILYLVAFQVFRSNPQLVRLAKVLGGIAVVTALGAIVESSLGLYWVKQHQLQAYIDASYLGVSGEWVIRPSSIGNGPGSAAMMEYIGAMALFALAASDQANRRRLVWLAAAALVLGGVLLGATRIIWLQMAIALVVFVVMGRGPRTRLARVLRMALPVAIGIAISVEFSGGEIAARYQTLETPVGTYRAERYGALLALPRIAADYPLGAGVGWNAPRRDLLAPLNVVEAVEYSGVHNYLSILTLELGIPGLVLFVAFSSLIILRGFRALRRSASQNNVVSSAYFAIFVSMFLSFLAGGGLIGWPGEYYWIFAGIIARTATLDPGADA